VHRLAALLHKLKESHSKNGLTTNPNCEIKQSLFNVAADVEPLVLLDLISTDSDADALIIIK
jgi:hypothetical protein